MCIRDRTTLYVLADGLARLLAPILSMTADEIWSRLPGTREASVHLADFPSSPQSWIDESLDAHWDALSDVRRTVNEALERARAEKTIGAPLTAHVTLTAGGDLHRLLTGAEADLPMLCIVSAVTLRESADSPLVVEVAHASGDKCPRCWRFVPALTGGGDDAVCDRCADALEPVA